MGLVAVMLVGHAGVEQVVMVGGRTGRLALARDLGAAATFDFLQLGDELIPAIRRQIGADILSIVETSGTASGMRNTLELIAREGQLILLGGYGTARADFPWILMIHREIEMIGSCASAGGWNDAVRLA